MGLKLQFFIGDKDNIVNAVADEDFDILEELEDQGDFADFSLHLSPKDLNVLINIISSHLSDDSFGLRENLDTEDCYFDENDRGAFYVKDMVKNLIAKTSEKDAAIYASRWYNKLSEEYPDEHIGDSSMAEQPISDLIRICQIALKEDKCLVHVWFL